MANVNLNESFFSFSSDSVDSDDSFHSSSSSPLLSALTTHFSNKPKNLNIVHINAQSIPAHYSDLLNYFDSQSFVDAILISESWLKPCLSSLSYSLPGYKLIRNDRLGRPGGGVAMYLKSNIKYKILKLSTQPPPADETEHLLIEITNGSSKLLLGVFYSPNLSFNYFDSFDKILEELSPLYDHVILMGDFNTCLLKGDSRSKKLTSLVNSYNLSLLPLNATHHYPHSTPSLLDLMIVSSPFLVETHGQYPAHGLSYHDCIFLSYKWRAAKSKPKVVMQRAFKDMDLDLLREDAMAVDWSAISMAQSIDDKVDYFNRLILDLFDKHAPLRPVKLKHLPAPWLNDELKTLINRKNRAKIKKSNSNSDKLKYNKLRNRCNTACRDAQKRYIQSSVENADQATTWKFLKSIGIGKDSKPSDPVDLNLEDINSHFASSAHAFDPNLKAQTIHALSNLPAPDHPPFTFRELSVSEVKKAVMAVSSRAVGHDCIGRNMIIPLLDILSPILAHILNFSLTTAAFPSSWKNAYIIPLPKKSTPNSFSDYRPISILPFLSKILERSVQHQLQSFLNTHNLLDPHQSGFRFGHSTSTALVKIADDIRLGMDQQYLTILTLLDFSNAFNSVDHDILLLLLRSLNLSPSVIDWFRSFLRGRRQRVKCDSIFSSWHIIFAGVPQGSVLSPLLFSIFINSVCRHISSFFHMYADDLQIYRQVLLPMLAHGIALVNADLGKILEWSKAYGLNLNPDKTQCLIIGSRQLIAKVDWNNLPNITLNGSTIPYSSSVRNLGVYFDRTLSWNVQVQEVRKKVSAASASLRRLSNFLPVKTKITLAQSLLFPILDYADVCYCDLDEHLISSLQRLQNLCIRFVFGLRKFDHVSEHRTKLKWLPIKLRRQSHILHLLYNVLFNPTTPVYLKDKFSFLGHNNPNLRSANKRILAFPFHKTSFYDSSFTVSAIRLWNSLPESIQNSDTISIFKKRLKDYFLEVAS